MTTDAPKLLSAARVAEIRDGAANFKAHIAALLVPGERLTIPGEARLSAEHAPCFIPLPGRSGGLPMMDLAHRGVLADLADLLTHVAVLESMLADVATDDARGLVSLGARMMRERAVAALTEHAVKAYDVHGDAEEAGVIMARAVVAALPDHPEEDAK